MRLEQFVIINIIISSYSIIAEYVADKCTPNSSISDGVCTLIIDCPPAIRALKETREHPFKRCGFSGDIEIVCCPSTTEKFGTPETPRITNRNVERECNHIKEQCPPNVASYIIGGVAAEIGEFPHMVVLAFDRGNGYEFDCGGSLVSKNYVLTAAHCIDTLDEIKPSVVRTGVIHVGGNTWNEETDYEVADIIIHPKYTRKEKYHDLALLRLERDVNFTNHTCPICIETGGEDPNYLVITGWGKTSVTRNTKSEVLLKADVSPVANEKCNEFYKNWRKLPHGISNEQMCAGDPKGEKDTCQGDSGGPLQFLSRDNMYRLIGVTSFGRGCGSGIPGVYTRLANYIDWIESIVWSN